MSKKPRICVYNCGLCNSCRVPDFGYILILAHFWVFPSATLSNNMFLSWTLSTVSLRVFYALIGIFVSAVSRVYNEILRKDSPLSAIMEIYTTFHARKCFPCTRTATVQRIRYPLLILDKCSWQKCVVGKSCWGKYSEVGQNWYISQIGHLTTLTQNLIIYTYAGVFYARFGDTSILIAVLIHEK